MKTIKLLLTLMCLLGIGSSFAFAQENANRDENGKIVRGPYLTNGAWDNWWVNLGGGITVFGDGGCVSRVTPALDLNFGKWFTPSIGFRVGYQGLTGSMWTPNRSIWTAGTNGAGDLYKAKFGYAYTHADFMWNISNAFFGYKETRFWNVTPYIHGGLLSVYKKGVGTDNEFAAGAGLYNTMRLNDRVALTLDLRGILTNGRQFSRSGVAGELSLTFGVAINLGRTSWTRKSTVVKKEEELLARISELDLERDILREQNRKLQEDNKLYMSEKTELEEDLASLDKDELVRDMMMEILPSSFYFGIGKTELSATELEHLDVYIESVRPCIQEGTTVILSARADDSTGSRKRNEYLNGARLQYVKGLLESRYQLIVKGYECHAEIVSSEHPELDRAVEIRAE